MKQGPHLVLDVERNFFLPYMTLTKMKNEKGLEHFRGAEMFGRVLLIANISSNGSVLSVK